MKVKCLFLTALIIAIFLIALPGFAKIYLSEDFENYKNGDDIVKMDKLWVVSDPVDNPKGGGVAFTERSHSGKISVLFERDHDMGFSFDSLNLPKSYALSCWFYHDSKQTPPPEAIVQLADIFPDTGNWFGVGTRSLAVKPENYTYRDKTGTGNYEDTGIPRRTEWVNFTFLVEPNKMRLLIDGKDIYAAKVGKEYYVGFALSRTPMWLGTEGKVFLDDVYIADTVNEIPKGAAVISPGKLGVTWAVIKARY